MCQNFGVSYRAVTAAIRRLGIKPDLQLNAATYYGNESVAAILEEVERVEGMSPQNDRRYHRSSA